VEGMLPVSLLLSRSLPEERQRNQKNQSKKCLNGQISVIMNYAIPKDSNKSEVILKIREQKYDLISNL
jgi:hypothetical protein